MEEQHSDNPMPVFSFLGNAAQHPRQLPCWITETNEHTHDIIRSGAVSSTQMLRAEYRAIIDEIARDVGLGRLECPTFSAFADEVAAESY